MSGILTLELQQSLVNIQAELDEVRCSISQSLDVLDIPLDAYIEYLNDNNTKMIRSALLLLSGKTFGPVKQEHITAAAMLELTYWAFLLHDQVDSPDWGQLNSGQQKLDNKAASILLGDFFLSLVFSFQTSLPIPQVGQIINQSALMLVTRGLQHKLGKNARPMGPTGYLELVKTRAEALFQASCRLGALIAGASDAQVQVLGDFGYQLGMIYQLADDLQTVTDLHENNEDCLTAQDLLNMQILPVVHFLDQEPQVIPKEQISLESCFVQMCEAGSIAFTREQIKQCVDHADVQLHSPELCSAAKPLSDLPGQIWEVVSRLEI